MKNILTLITVLFSLSLSLQAVDPEGLPGAGIPGYIPYENGAQADLSKLDYYSNLLRHANALKGYETRVRTRGGWGTSPIKEVIDDYGIPPEYADDVITKTKKEHAKQLKNFFDKYYYEEEF